MNNISSGTKALRAALAILAILAMAGLAASCDNGYGIFKSIQLETEQVGTDIFKSASVKKIVTDGTDYFAASSKLHRRPVGGSTWELISPIGSSNYFATGLAASGTTLYVAAANPVNNSLIGVYTSTDSGDTWTALPDQPALASGETPQNFFMANGVPFLLTRLAGATGNYTLWEYGTATPATWTGIPALTGLSEPVVSVEWDGTSYWAASGKTLYTDSSADSLSVDLLAGTPSGGTKTFVSLLADGITLYAACDDGTAYALTGAAWSASKTLASGVKLGAMASVPVSAIVNRLLVARYDSSYGYLEYDWAASTPHAGAGGVLANESSYSTTVSGKPVNSFFYDGNAASGTLFACLSAGTGGYGLYRNDWDGTVWGGWIAE